MPMGTVAERTQLMLDAVNGIERLIGSKTYEDFVANPDLPAAAERYFERLSAALGHAPESLRTENSTVDWQAIATIGNLLRHVYDRSLDRRLWQVAKENLPGLKQAVLSTMRGIDAG